MDWESYLTSNSDYVAFISNWSCHWWRWRLCCPDRRESHFLQLLDGDFLCALHYAVLYNNLRVCESLLRDKKCGMHSYFCTVHMYVLCNCFSCRYQRNQSRDSTTHVCTPTKMVKARCSRKIQLAIFRVLID
jgi:hypothetical protein